MLDDNTISDSSLQRGEETILVTFAMMAYNQEGYIQEAIESALSQEYEPLEIILSDDHSSDRTFEMMKEIIDQYDGPHKVVLNKNDKNVGIGEHINKIMEMANGELIVAAAGDDISLPHRTDTLVNAWKEGGCIADSIHSKVITLSESGDEGDELQTSKCGTSSPVEFIKGSIIIGASHAWTKRVFQRFGPLNPSIVCEDRAIGFRSAITGGVSYVDTPLVKYRLGGVSSNAPKGGFSRRKLDGLMQNLSDVLTLEPHNSTLICSILSQITRNLMDCVVLHCRPGLGVWLNAKLHSEWYQIKRLLKYVVRRK